MNKRQLIVAVPTLALWLVGAPAQGQQRCGGTERWFVKTGIDPDAAKVDIFNTAPITIGELNQLPSLRDTVAKGDNQTRLAGERVVYQVTGRLVLFKNEDDSDYHLVITDDSLKFTPGGKGTDGLETGTSFIAEIPDPDCAAGRKGPAGAKSLWDSQIRSARAAFDARFPSGQGADSDLGGIPVTLTGVLFYDRQHQQTGRAINGVELHPVLMISFSGSPPPGPALLPTNPSSNEGESVTQLLANPGFEDGVTGWSGTTDDIGSYPPERAHRGEYFAWMGGLGTAHSEALYQNVTIPDNAKSAALSFWVTIQTDETTTKAADRLYVQIRDNSGHLLKQLSVLSNLDASRAYTNYTFDVSEFTGKDVQVFLKVVENGARATSFKVDDLALTAK